MKRPNDLLYPLFSYLRRSGLPLGVNDYILVLRVLRSGHGLEDLERLRDTCRLLWAKSREDQVIFDESFRYLVEPLFRPLASVSYPPQTEGVTPIEPSRRDRTVTPTPDPVAEHEVAQDQPDGVRSGVLPVTDFTSEALAADLELSTHIFQLTPRLPLSRREATYIWRQLRRMRRAGPLLDLDVEGTISTIARQGYFLRPVLQARQRNQASLLLLIDLSNSMEPFDALVNALVESILHGGFAATARIYYFQNTPDDFLSPQRNLAQRQPLKEVLEQTARERPVLIISDAGSARRAYRRSRVLQTQAFLQTLHSVTYLYAWLNPTPAAYWPQTSAAVIAQLAPMFALDREGLADAVGILRGQPFPRGVNVNGQL